MKYPDTIIVMGCSEKKSRIAQQAIGLYEGPMWTSMRKYIGKFPKNAIFVLSAGYGFIDALAHIQPYEAKLTTAEAERQIARGAFAPNNRCGRAIERQSGRSPADTIRPPAYKNEQPIKRVMIAAGGEYRRVIESYVAELVTAGIIAAGATIEKTSGGIGEQRSQLGAWLQKFNEKEVIAA